MNKLKLILILLCIFIMEIIFFISMAFIYIPYLLFLENDINILHMMIIFFISLFSIFGYTNFYKKTFHKQHEQIE